MHAPLRVDAELCAHAQRLCQELLRIDTTNPPGNERPAADLLAGELSAAGIDPVLLESAPRRANLVARLAGSGELPPLLLTAHLDVVEADASAWAHPPFSGELADGYLWGRGAIDMKNMAAMAVAIMTRLAREKVRLRRELIFAAVADEEMGCRMGSAWLCAHHPERVKAEYALGEQGGFPIYLGNTMFVTVQVAEKGFAWLRARVKGEPGHGSMPREDSAVVRLCAAIARLGKTRLPLHSTPVVADFFDAVARRQKPLVRPLAGRLLRPEIVSRLLPLLPDKSIARAMLAMLSNTASPTVLRAGNKTNVIPGVAEVEIDGRTLPGQTTEDLLRELRAVLGPDVELEVMRDEPPVVTEPARSPLYDAIAAAVVSAEPEAVVVPCLIPGYTDAKFFTRLGMRWYGFTPVKFPRGVRFADLYHGTDERIPVEGLAWGTRILADVVDRVCR
jgi:acetylornithine deacetylase/succinyl-diaminopimelate desuccinylase-like protein